MWSDANHITCKLFVLSVMIDNDKTIITTYVGMFLTYTNDSFEFKMHLFGRIADLHIVHCSLMRFK